MKISVIIPSYKPGSYLFDCLESVMNQTLDKALYEVIVVLNGPRHPYWERLQDYAQEYSCMRLHYENCLGVSNARNHGLKMASGDYVCFIDDDDIISRNYLNGLLEKANAETIAVSDVRVFIDDINNVSSDYISKAYSKISHTGNTHIFFKRKFLSSACCKIIPKAIIGDSCFNASFKVGEDALFMFSISKGIKRIELADDAVYYRRYRAGSASRTKKTILFKLKNCLMQVGEYCRIYFKNPFQYNFLLFLSRLVASTIHVVR